jgi:hypothetical protein
MLMRRRIGAVTAMFALGCLSASAFAREPMRYQFKNTKEAVYQVDTRVETDEKISGFAGYLMYQVQPVNGSNGDLLLRLTSTMTKKPEMAVGAEKPTDAQTLGVPLPVAGTDGPNAREIVISSLGELLRSKGEDSEKSEDSGFFGGGILLPQVPKDSDRSWKTVGTYTIPNLKDNERQVIEELGEFSMLPSEGVLLKFKSRYILNSREKVNNTPKISALGEGEFTFDPNQGMVVTANVKLTMTYNTPNITVRVPMTIKSRLLTPDEVTQRRQEYLTKNLSSARAQPQASRSAPPAPGSGFPRDFNRPQPPGPPAPPAPQGAPSVTQQVPTSPEMTEELRVRRLTMMRDQPSAPMNRPDRRQNIAGTFRSKQVGMTAGVPFVFASEKLEPVVGFQYELSNWGNKSVLRKLEPLYERPKNKPETGYIGAREGYVVAGVIISSTDFANAFRVIFAKMNEGKTDSKTTYFSDWIGKPQSETETRLGNNGSPVVGVFGTRGMNVHGFGLVQAGEPNPPSAEELEKIKKREAMIDTYWQPTTAAAKDLLPEMPSNGTRNADGTISIRGVSQFTETIPRIVAPATLRIVLQSDGGDTRLAYAADQVIFNWDGRPDELRIDGGPANGQHKPGAGSLPANEWVAIEWVVRLDEMIIYVNGKERCRARGDFTKIDKPLTIRAHRGTVMIRSVTLVQ